MRKVMLVALRDYLAAVRTKGFIIGLILVPLLFGGGIIVIRITESRVDTTDRRIAVIDHTGVVADALIEAANRRNESETHDLDTGKKTQPAYLLTAVVPNEADIEAQRLELSNQVRGGELSAFIEIGKDAIHPSDDPASRITYYSQNPLFDNVRYWLVNPVNDRIRSVRIAEADFDVETVNRLTRWMPVESLGLITVDEETGEVRGGEADKLETIGIPYAMMMLMFVLIMAAVNPLVNAVVEEKMQRIAEVLLGCIRPSQLMMGKLLGAIGVAVTMVALYLIAGVAAARYMHVSSVVPYGALPWFAAYGVAALFMFGSLVLAAGSACSDMKEAQSALLPLWIFIFLPMFLWFPVMKDPNSALATWLSLFPTFTPMLMLVRLASPMDIPAWQPWVGLVGVVLATAASVWAAGRIFRVGILMQGKSPRPSEILRWALKG